MESFAPTRTGNQDITAVVHLSQGGDLSVVNLKCPDWHEWGEMFVKTLLVAFPPKEDTLA